MTAEAFDTHKLAISRAFWSVVMLKPISAIIGVSYLLLLIKALDKSEFAIYVAGWAIIEMVALITNAGTLPAAYRYIFRASDSNSAPVGPVIPILFVRVITLLAGVLFLYIVLDGSKGNEIIRQLYNAFPIIAIMIIAEGTARLIDVMLESSLYQRRAQVSQISRITFKLVPACYFYETGNFSINTVLIAEVIGIITGLIMASILLYSAYLNKNMKRKSKSVDNFSSRAVMIRYSFMAYLASAAAVLHNPDALKILISKFSTSEILASFGFAYAIVGFMQRYIPANILAGFVRPLYVITAKNNDNGVSLNNFNNVFIKLNMIVVLVYVTLFFSNSNLILSLISNDYLDSIIIMKILVISIFVTSLKLALANFCLAREMVKPNFFSEISCWATLALAVPMTQAYGALGVAVTVLIDELLWVAVCVGLLLRSEGSNLSLDWVGMLKIVILTMGVAFIPEFFVLRDWVGMAYSGVALCVLAAAIWHLSIFSRAEWSMLKGMLNIKTEGNKSFSAE